MEQQQQNQIENTFSPFKLSILSSIGVLIGDILVYPLDTLAVRQKVNKQTQIYSTYNEMKMIIQKENFLSLYRGFNTILASTLLPSVIYFYSYESMNRLGKEMIKKNNSDNVMKKRQVCLVPLVSSALAELLSLLSYLPVDIVRTRLQLNDCNYQYRSLMSGLREVKQKEGILRMYKASHLYIINNISFTCLQFWMYELLRIQILQRRTSSMDQTQMTIQETIAVCLFTTTLATIVTSPIDIVFTRQQILDSRNSLLSGTQIFKDILKYEGPSSLFKGLQAKTLQGCMIALTVLPLYEHFKAKFGVNFHIDL